jgi:plasmid stabilization system protein ParE
LRVELSPEALARFHEIQEDLRATNQKRARAFAAEMRRIGSILRLFPRAGTPIGEFRRMVLNNFLYYILYSIEEDHVRITTIEHQKAQRGPWTGYDRA